MYQKITKHVSWNKLVLSFYFESQNISSNTMTFYSSCARLIYAHLLTTIDNEKWLTYTILPLALVCYLLNISNKDSISKCLIFFF